MLHKIILFIMVGLAFIMPQQKLEAATIDEIRSSVTSARVRIVLDSKSPIKYKINKENLELIIDLPESSSKKLKPIIKDDLIQAIDLKSNGKNASVLKIKLEKNCQYKAFTLSNPCRLVLDFFKIEKLDRVTKLQTGINYRFIQDELDGKQYQAHIAMISPKVDWELRPFSAAGSFNGRGSLLKSSLNNGALVAINSSYFDSDGWVVGITKNKDKVISMEEGTRSAFMSLLGKPIIVKDLQYTAHVELRNGEKLPIKGMNRARIAEDCVLYNDAYATSTKTNQWGREIKIKNGRVVSVSNLGNMPIEPGTVVVSGHGENAKKLQMVRPGDKVNIIGAFNVEVAEKAEVVVGAGPLLLENGGINVRSREENIPRDISQGRAPRTAIAIKPDDTILLVVVDGRSDSSSGMTLVELAHFLQRLGAVEALNFDGGGSSEMVIKGKIVNRPSDGKERLISMGLGLFPKGH